MRYFTLKTVDRITPSTGEDVGDLLVKSANAKLEQIEKSEYKNNYCLSTVAQILYLAADAYNAGAAASLGHSRSMRYECAAKKATQQADALYAEEIAKKHNQPVTL